ncbi:LysR family transcriptional regulator [Tumebacillus flagellatus]|uniref:Transcriptional regulator n=1 Tax=Tumebacillus flagellatus TaxID=1157490 RepID=A0A074MDK9_9BACL|nr:LysR family transcriptional regulator [Tumebacillus flagellatus]KEO83932.1 transcriptional regulator [Tumebacillus flagellatus]
MELRHLNTFRVVAEVKGFTRAAELLGYAQSSVTAQIQALEEELGVQLFNRLGKRIVLTEAGTRLLPFVVEIQKLVETAKSELLEAQVPQGTLTIGAPESLCAFRLPPLLQEFRRQHPTVKIVLRPGLCWQLRQQVRSGELDLAFLLDEEKPEGNDLHAEVLMPEPICLIAPPQHPLAARKAVYPHDLKDETLFLTEVGCTYRTLFEQQLNAVGIYLDQQLEFGSLEAIKQCVITGIGLAQLPQVVIQNELADNRLVALPWAGSAVDVHTILLYHKSKWISPAMRAFLTITHDHFHTQKTAR